MRATRPLAPSVTARSPRGPNRLARLARPPLLAALLAGLLAGTPPAVAQDAAPAGRLVRLPTLDGKDAAGALYLPPAHAPRAGVVVVHGYGGNFYSGVPAHLAPALADRGVAALAVNLRDHDGGPKTTLFEEGRWDVQAAIDALDHRGVGPVVLAGHSLGTNTVLHVAAESRDARLRALVLLAPPGNAFEWNVRLFGRERATAVLEEAERLRAAGRGRELMLVDLGPLGRALYSADHLVSLRGPATRSDPYRNLAAVAVPVLVVAAGADRLVDPGIPARLRAAAPPGGRVDLVEIPEADHGFTRHREALAETVSRWLTAVLGR